MTVFVIAMICIGGAAFFVRFLIALYADIPKHTCEITHMVRYPDGLRVPIHAKRQQSREIIQQFQHSQSRLSQAR
jgi:hypothetical protein